MSITISIHIHTIWVIPTSDYELKPLKKHERDKYEYIMCVCVYAYMCSACLCVGICAVWVDGASV